MYLWRRPVMFDHLHFHSNGFPLRCNDSIILFCCTMLVTAGQSRVHCQTICISFCNFSTPAVYPWLFLTFPVENVGVDEYRSKVWTVYFANTQLQKQSEDSIGVEPPTSPSGYASVRHSSSERLLYAAGPVTSCSVLPPSSLPFPSPLLSSIKSATPKMRRTNH